MGQDDRSDDKALGTATTLSGDLASADSQVLAIGGLILLAAHSAFVGFSDRQAGCPGDRVPRGGVTQPASV